VYAVVFLLQENRYLLGGIEVSDGFNIQHISF
jgi:hypothetical protein